MLKKKVSKGKVSVVDVTALSACCDCCDCGNHHVKKAKKFSLKKFLFKLIREVTKACRGKI